MAPLWLAMLSKNSPIYRESLFSFSMSSARNLEKDMTVLRKQMEKERSLLHGQLRNLKRQQQILAASTKEELDK